MRDGTSANRQTRVRMAAVFAVVGALVFVGWSDGWFGSPSAAAVRLQDLSEWLEPRRRAWYALPFVALAFVLLGLAMVPVLLLIAATGVAFGPFLGPLYAMAGCLASASMGFAIGRWTGLGRIERVGGTRVTRIVRSLERNGTLAVFLLRKIPAPFLVANIVAGASRVSYRDFIVGTLLGMTAIVVALAGFGYHLTNVLESPSTLSVLGALVFVGIPLTLAWFINRALRQPGHTA
jgi:phospholipase D1/2